jgi:hypothetical protein
MGTETESTCVSPDDCYTDRENGKDGMGTFEASSGAGIVGCAIQTRRGLGLGIEGRITE